MKKRYILLLTASCFLLALAVFFLPTANQSASEPSPVLADVPSPAVSTEPSPKASARIPWNLTLVNAEHPLEAGFSISSAELSNGKSFDARACGALNNMLRTGEAQGLSFVVCSAYRSVEYQETLFRNQVASYIEQGYTQQEAEEKTATEILPPGTSEHNLGLAADIVSLSYQVLDEAQADTPEQQWLMEHCWEYGFILRYPADKQDITGIIYEPWHYRYVGVEAALAMRDSGQCLEEYLASVYSVG